MAFIEMGGAAANLDVSAFVTADVLHCEVRQDAWAVDAHRLAGLFDLQSSDWPGGRSGAIALNAAKRIAQLHGGQLEARPGGRRRRCGPHSTSSLTQSGRLVWE